ncbi:MAG: CarD family transcriptional regulator [Alphaproteobacteria bacterium]|nr:CarD family transcriptional regulator [Alphaproteobacteria bacterium]
MQFKVGDKAVYPAHGVGVIRAIETRQIEDQKNTFYILKILDNGMTIMVPIQNADAIGMRTVIEQAHVEKIYEVLRDRETPTDNQTWNRRYREYMSNIKTGDPLAVAKVLRDLALMKLEKNLSFGERKMYDQARNLLVQEIAVAKDTDEGTIEAEIEEIFSPTKGKPKAKVKAKKK